MGESAKQQYELYAFLQLIEIACIDADVLSIRQLNPPNPDIICKVSGTKEGLNNPPSHGDFAV